MDYVDKFMGYMKELPSFYPAITNNTSATSKPMASSGSALPFNLYGGFGLEEYIFFGLVLCLFLTMLVMKYDSYRFFRLASKEIRQDVARDVKQLLDEKFTQEFFEYFLRNFADQSTQATQVETTELDISTSSGVYESPSASMGTPKTPKTPRQSRIPVVITPLRRSNTDCSPTKRAEGGDPGSAIRPHDWERRNR